jgi:tight adherence protein D
MSSRRTLRGAVLLGGVLLGLVTGCVTERGPQLPDALASETEPPAPKDNPKLHLELIEKMLEGGRAHAALAHLDSLAPEQAATPGATLLRAEALRRIGDREQASHLYDSLLTTEAAAPAWRGLALIKVDQGDLETAVTWLGKARDLQPTSARIRNDLGYALILRGDLERAKLELVTALELESARRTARNLVLVLLLEGRPEAAERLARQHKIEGVALERLRERAESLRARVALGGGS